ncbi:unnamed protein product [Calicophoron daubneyi]|uniref:Uncharacterized protein n=1 Tax=Calicophoron daubneyi TaxID=300641 RepID=A0AAV2TWM3_CALDB
MIALCLKLDQCLITETEQSSGRPEFEETGRGHVIHDANSEIVSGKLQNVYISTGFHSNTDYKQLFLYPYFLLSLSVCPPPILIICIPDFPSDLHTWVTEF